MTLLTTVEKLNTLVTKIREEDADVANLLAAFDAANNYAPEPFERLFDDGERSVKMFRRLFGGELNTGTTKVWVLAEKLNFLGGVKIEPLLSKIKKKVEFKKDEPNDSWLNKVNSNNPILKKEEARKFFYRRFLLSSFEDKDIFTKAAYFHDDFHLETVNQGSPDDVQFRRGDTTNTSLLCFSNNDSQEEPSPYVKKDTIQDLWLYAKFNELKEEKKIPKDYEYKAFVGWVRKSIKAAAEKAPGQKVTTQDIVDAVNEEQAQAATTIQKIFKDYSVRRKDLEEGAKKIKEFQINRDKRIREKRIENKISEEKLKRNAKNLVPDSVKTEEIISKMRKKLQEVSDGKKSSDPTRGEWQADGTRNVTYQYLVDNNYVSNGENDYLIPEIKGREPGAVTQYTKGLPVFNYKDLNEFSQDTAEAGKREWNANDERLLSSIACIGEGENKRYCVVTSSVRGVTKAFISQTEFNEITSNAASFYDFGLESAIKTTALDETLEVLNMAKKRYESFIPKEDDKIKIINDEIAAIEVRRTLITESNNYSVDKRLSRLYLYNNLDIALPDGINFNEEEKNRFKAAKSRTVVADDDSYNTTLKSVLEADAVYDILRTLKEAKTRHENEKKALEEEKKYLEKYLNHEEQENLTETTKQLEEKIKEATNDFNEQYEDEDEEEASDKLRKFVSMLEGTNKHKIELKELAIKQLEEAINNFKNSYDRVMFEKTYELLSKDKAFLDEEKRRIKESIDKVINDEDEPQEIIRKLISAEVKQIDYARNFADEFGIKAHNRKEKLEEASVKEKESARHSASCRYSLEMAKSVERSIENEVINGLDTFEVKSMAEDMVNKYASFYQSKKAKEEYTKAVRKTCKAPVPHTNVNGVGFHRPRGTSIVSVGFSYNGVGRDSELTGNTEAYVHIDGSNQCYIGCRVCPKDGMNMSVLIDGKSNAKKEYKRGDTAINQNTISFLNPKTQKYDHIEASPSKLKAHLELMKKDGNPYSGSVETIMAQYKKMQIKVTSQVNNNTLAEDPDIERKVSIMHKGNTLSYNADAENPRTALAKKKVVTKAFDINSKGSKIDNLIPGFDIDSQHKPQYQFVKMNIIKLPDGTNIAPYVKLLTHSDGEAIDRESDLYRVTDYGGRMDFEKLTPEYIEGKLRSGRNVDEDDIKDKATKLFERAENDCRNTKLILPLGITGEEKGKKYKISTPDDFAGVGRENTDNKPSSSFSFRVKEPESKATKLEDVNNLNTVPEFGIGERFNSKILGRPKILDR
jgi:hypothetical protein